MHVLGVRACVCVVVGKQMCVEWKRGSKAGRPIKQSARRSNNKHTRCSGNTFSAFCCGFSCPYHRYANAA